MSFPFPSPFISPSHNKKNLHTKVAFLCFKKINNYEIHVVFNVNNTIHGKMTKGLSSPPPLDKFLYMSLILTIENIKEEQTFFTFFFTFIFFLKFFFKFLLGFQAHLLFQLWTFCSRQIFKLWSPINLFWGHVKSHTKLGPDCLAVLMFIRNKQTEKQSIYIDGVTNRQKSKVFT